MKKSVKFYVTQYNHTLNFLGMSNYRVKLSQRFAKRLLSINTVCCMASGNEFFLVTPRNPVKRILTFSRLMTYIYIYMSYRTLNLQMLHFIYLFNKYTY